MQQWKLFAALLLVMTALTAATLACNVEDAIFGMATPSPSPTEPMNFFTEVASGSVATHIGK